MVISIRKTSGVCLNLHVFPVAVIPIGLMHISYSILLENHP